MRFVDKVLRKFSHQTMVYLPKTGDSSVGKPTYANPGSPSVLPCLWQNKPREIILSDSRTIKCSGYILTAVPIVMGSLVFLNPQGVTDLSAWMAIPTFPNVPTVKQGVREVIYVCTTADPNAAEFVYETYI